MPILEIKAINAVAKLHRGIINLSIKTIGIRHKRAYVKLEKAKEYSADLIRLSKQTKDKAISIRDEAETQYNETRRTLYDAENRVLNLRDDLTKLTA